MMTLFTIWVTGSLVSLGWILVIEAVVRDDHSLVEMIMLACLWPIVFTVLSIACLLDWIYSGPKEVG